MSRFRRFEEENHEEGVRAVLDGPEQVGTAAPAKSSTVPTFSLLCAPVSEMADERGLQPRAHSGHPGPIPGWGTTYSPTRGLGDIIAEW